MSASLKNPAVATGLEKVSVFIPIPKKGSAKECSNYWTIAPTSHASEVMLRILQARLQQWMNQELPDVQAGFKKCRVTGDQIANIHWIIEKASELQKKHLHLFHSLRESLWLCGSQQTVESSERDGNTRRSYLSPKKPVCWSGSKLEPYMEQLTDSKLGKEYNQVVHCHPVFWHICGVHYVKCWDRWVTSWN